MKPFEATSPNVEVNGETVLAIVAGMGTFSEKAKEILASHGIENPQPGHWYKQQAWLNAFRDIATKLGPNTLMQIGKKIPEQAKFPPQITTIEHALGAINQAYQMNHRGGEIGSYDLHLMDKNKARIVCRNPYPSEFDKGIITAMANRFKPAGSFVCVDRDENQPTRAQGGESCTFLVTW